MSLQKIIGQDKAIDFLRSVTRYGRVAHAYLFVGPPGVGKASVAGLWARWLLCSSATPQGPCGSCPSCLKDAAGWHPDIIRVAPEGEFIKIDAIREASRALSLKGFESSKKVLIIDGAHHLNEEASNALLKTLEEPSGGTVILLIADSVKSVLPTIASRCQRVYFRALSDEMIVSTLTGAYRVGREEAVYLARMADGSLGRALAYRDNRLFERKNGLIGELTVAEAGRERRERQQKAREMLEVLASWYRDLLMAKAGVADRLFVNSDRKDEIRRVSPGLSAQILEKRLSAIASGVSDLEHHANIRLVLARLRTELR